MKKTKIRGAFARFMAHYLETTKSGIVESLLVRPVIYPSGKPRIPHLPASAGSDDLRVIKGSA